MNKMIALIAVMTALAGFCDATVKTYTAPDEMNVVTEHTDENGVKTYSQTTAHVVQTDAATDAPKTPYIEKKTRSPLGQELDRATAYFASNQKRAFDAIVYEMTMLTNLAARVEALEAAEKARAEHAAKLRAMSLERRRAREEKPEDSQVLRDAIKRGKKVEASQKADAAKREVK